MATRSKKGSSDERGTDKADDGKIKDASATIVELSTAVVALSNIASRAEEDRLDIQGALGECATAFQDMQAYMKENRSSSTTKTDPIVGEVVRGTKPVLEPMPDVKPLHDGFRYKPDLANPSARRKQEQRTRHASTMTQSTTGNLQSVCPQIYAG